MDYILFLIGLWNLYKNNYKWLFAIIIILGSTYLQLPLTEEQKLMFGPAHNVADTGMLLLLLFAAKILIKKQVISINSRINTSIFLFLLFVILNGLLDIIFGISIGDVIKYIRNWTFLILAFVPFFITRKEVDGTFKIIFWCTFGISIALIIQHIIGAAWIGGGTSSGYYSNGVLIVRAAKPASYAIPCFILAFINYFNLSKFWRIATCLAFMIPIILCAKMSYFTTIALCLAVYYLIKSRFDLIKITKYALISIVGFSVLFAASPGFRQRLSDTMEQGRTINDAHQEEGNFTYRINHFAERFDYVTSDPIRAIRGMGYIQEKHFNIDLFKLGQRDTWGGKAQLDTGDIAWSIFIIRLGLLGILIYIIMYGKFLQYFYARHKLDNINLFWFSYMLVAIGFMSFGNTIVAMGEFFLLPMLYIKSKTKNN